MDRRTMMAITLTFLVYYSYLAWMAANQPPPPEVEELPVAEAPAPEPVVPVSASSTSNIPVRELPFEACDFTATLSTEGGGLQDVSIPAVEAPLAIQTAWGKVLSLTPFVDGWEGWQPYGPEPEPLELSGPGGAIAAVGTGAFTTLPRFEVLDQRQGAIALRGVTADGVEIRHQYTEVAETEDMPCHLAVQTSWTTTGSAPSQGPWIGVHANMVRGAGYYDNALRPYAVVDEAQDYEIDLDNVAEPRLSEGPVSWFGVADRYFMAGLLPENKAEGVLYFSQRDRDGETFGAHLVYGDGLAPGAVHRENYQLFVGEKNREALDQLDPSLAVLQNFGWVAVFADPLLWLLVFLEGLVGNWGLAIISLTVLVKGVLFPLTHRGMVTSQRAAADMQRIKPQLDHIRETYAEQPDELNRRTMELFQKEGVNPMASLGGCLPMLVQMPVWFALYRVLLQAPQLYHTDFLYLRDLSSVDPYGVLPLSVVVLMVMQQRLTPMGNMDPAQARVMKLMPVIFGLFFFTFPSGLVLYIFVNTVLSIVQQWWIRKSLGMDTSAHPQGAAT